MKNFIYFLILLVFAFTSCEKGEIIDPTSDHGEELISTSLKGKQDKVTICHKGKTITVNNNALNAHLAHGDKRAPCGYTYIPDDVFEQNLIDQGYDDVLDDYVLTESIEGIQVLRLWGRCCSGYPAPNDYNPILDYTGLEDFLSLQELHLNYMQESVTDYIIDLSKNINLRKLFFSQTDYNGINLSGNLLLEELTIIGDLDRGFRARITNLDLRANTNLKTLWVGGVDSSDNLNLILERAPSIETFRFLGFYLVKEISLVNNINLRRLDFYGECLAVEFIDLKNGANLNLESIYFGGPCPISSTGEICIQADDPDYIRSITSWELEYYSNTNIIFTTDCGY